MNDFIYHSPEDHEHHQRIGVGFTPRCRVCVEARMEQERAEHDAKMREIGMRTGFKKGQNAGLHRTSEAGHNEKG